MLLTPSFPPKTLAVWRLLVILLFVGASCWRFPRATRLHAQLFKRDDPRAKPVPPPLPQISPDNCIQRLLVTYSPPLSNGGEEITSYWVELDPTPTFDDPITEAFRCPNSPDYATWVVETSSNASIRDG